MMILPPFESSNRDESNGKTFIEIQSLDHDLFAILYLHELHYKSRDLNCGIAELRITIRNSIQKSTILQI